MKKQPVMFTTQTIKFFYLGKLPHFYRKHNASFIYPFLSHNLLKRILLMGQNLTRIFTALTRTFLSENDILKIVMVWWWIIQYD